MLTAVVRLVTLKQSCPSLPTLHINPLIMDLSHLSKQHHTKLQETPNEKIPPTSMYSFLSQPLLICAKCCYCLWDSAVLGSLPWPPSKFNLAAQPPSSIPSISRTYLCLSPSSSSPYSLSRIVLLLFWNFKIGSHVGQAGLRFAL